ncbi:MAG: hypothetical protein OXR73_16685, partial [Myxococcales bacterium]|nr:hypothetical protein [Myxococcales bacterium]
CPPCLLTCRGEALRNRVVTQEARSMPIAGAGEESSPKSAGIVSVPAWLGCDSEAKGAQCDPRDTPREHSPQF